MYACGLSSRPPSAAPTSSTVAPSGSARSAYVTRATRELLPFAFFAAARVDGAFRGGFLGGGAVVGAPHAPAATVRSAAPRAPSWSAEGGGAIATMAGERVAGPRKSGESATPSRRA